MNQNHELNDIFELKDFFIWLNQYNWERFDQIEDAFEQARLYREIQDRFKELVALEAAKEAFDFNELELLIQSQEAIEELPFMGKIYTVVNPNLLRNQLTEIARKVAFDCEKEHLKPACECALRYKYKLNPDSGNLVKTGIVQDGYYDYTIYECTTCNFKWSACIMDDAAGNTRFDVWNEEK